MGRQEFDSTPNQRIRSARESIGPSRQLVCLRLPIGYSRIAISEPPTQGCGQMRSLLVGPQNALLTGRGVRVSGTRRCPTGSCTGSRWFTARNALPLICRACFSQPLILSLLLFGNLSLILNLSLIGAPLIGAAEPEFPEAWYFEQQQAIRSNLEGGLAIELATETWIGQSTTLADCRGKVVVLDFWATWCGPCVASIPKNIELVDAHPDDLVFIGMHSQTSGWDKADQMVKDQAINYPVVLDTGETAKSYGINAFPTYIIIDRSGIVRAAGIKPVHVKTIVQQLIEESGARGPTMKIAAFEPDWFYRGSERMRPWQEQFGQSARPIQARDWWSPGDGSDDMLNQDAANQVSQNQDTASGNNADQGDVEPDKLESGDESQIAADSEPSNAEGSISESVAREFDAPDGLDLADLTGVVRVLHFTRPGMAITQKQLQSLNETAAMYAPQGVVFVVVCDHQSDWTATRAMATKMELSVPIAWDDTASDERSSVTDSESGADAPTSDPRVSDQGPTSTPREAGRTAQSYHVRVAPVTVIVDRNGRIRATGLKMEQLGAALNLLLAEQAG